MENKPRITLSILCLFSTQSSLNPASCIVVSCCISDVGDLTLLKRVHIHVRPTLSNLSGPTGRKLSLPLFLVASFSSGSMQNT